MSLLAYVTLSVAFAACIQVIAAQSGSHDGTYQPIESCQVGVLAAHYHYEIMALTLMSYMCTLPLCHLDKSSLHLQVWSRTTRVWRRTAAKYHRKSTSWDILQIWWVLWTGKQSCQEFVSTMCWFVSLVSLYIACMQFVLYALLHHHVLYSISTHCLVVGTYNDSDATEYCMRVSDTTLTGSILQGRSEEETR